MAEISSTVWSVGSLLRAISDTLQARFGPVAVRGEISGLTRAASGHCYFSLKDEQGQLRCALFRRAALLSGVELREGMRVEARGRLDVYGPRGDLQFIVESLRPAGQGSLFEQFLRIKAELEAQGYFDSARKRPLPAMPRSLAVVTSPDAAALRDVASTLGRRVPHVPVTVYPALVQGEAAPASLCAALRLAYRRFEETGEGEVLLLVRGGGSLEDLWAFNSPLLVKTLAQAPMPIVCGVGHETDFTLADFVADLRAPTPTAAAELCAPSRETALSLLDQRAQALEQAVWRRLDLSEQRLDRVAQRLGRPSALLAQERVRLSGTAHRIARAVGLRTERAQAALTQLQARLPQAMVRDVRQRRQGLEQAAARLALLDPTLVLQRGYAWLADDSGHAITSVTQAVPGQPVSATLSDGRIDMTVLSTRS